MPEFNLVLGTIKLPGLALGVSLAQWWLSHRHRRDVASVSYIPGEDALLTRHTEDCSVSKIEILNKWPGFAYERDGGALYESLGDLGALSQIFRHLHYCVFRGLSEHCQWFLAWCADCVQNPAVKSRVAVVLDSILKGAGKGVYVHWFGKHVIGALSGNEQYVCVQGCDRLCGDVSRFASLTSEKLLCAVDEGELPPDATSQKKIVAALKSKVTEPLAVLERKFFEAVQVLCCLRIIVLTNQFAPVLFGRRFALYQLDDRYANNPAYFKPLVQALTAENGQLFLSYLSAFDVTTWNSSVLPDKAYSRQLQYATTQPLLRWCNTWVSSVEACCVEECFIKCKTIYDLYVGWVQEQGELHRVSVARLATLMVHYGLATFIGETVRDTLRFAKQVFLMRMAQLMPQGRVTARSSTDWVPSEFLPLEVDLRRPPDEQATTTCQWPFSQTQTTSMRQSHPQTA